MSAVPPVHQSFDNPIDWVDRPFVSMNMVATIDGKILSGKRDEHVMDLGSSVDHATMRAIENAHDAVLIGAGSLRATPGLWYPKRLKRFVVTRSGSIDVQSRFFTDAPDDAYVVFAGPVAPSGVLTLPYPSGIDWEDLLHRMRHELGVRRLLVEGGSETNAEFLSRDLVDELFLTVAPKVKLGRDVPTYAGGDPLPRNGLLDFELAACETVGDEVFLRYRRSRP